MIYHTKGLYNLDEEVDWVEYFAGMSACTHSQREAGYRAARLDIKFFDQKNSKTRKGRKTSNYYDLTSNSGFILACVMVMKGRSQDFIAWLAMKCSSFCGMNVGTSGRSAAASIGRDWYKSVKEANCLLERTICLCQLVTACFGVWVVEQPGSSVLDYYPAWLHFLARQYQVFGTCAVWKTRWWMMMYGSQSPKRHWAYSNSRSIGKLDIGSKKGFKSKITTVEKYTNRAGKVCYKGTDKLRGTEKFGQISPYFLKINFNCVKMLLIEKCVINYRDCCLPT
ncbi:unnamed protein product [Cladocopium goreaui]|uniref:Uncharacterized protein n=1 Tax=Cladocopium goreaui TaxID=2562237 RepID=A0A9P1D178_9DINO|nr:unnamed protein product [Cladocopium goreaui]